MSRPLRVEYPDAVYHVMNRGAARQPIFRTSGDREAFLSILESCWKRWRLDLYAYCLMDNHYHLCLKTPEAKLSRVMRHLNGIYTQRYNRAHGRDGPLFRGRYKALLIEEEGYLGQVVRYIHLNPVEAGLVKCPKDYAWSSHRHYLKAKAPEWISRDRLLSSFGSARAFHNFVLEGNEDEFSEIFAGRRWPVILGSEDFIEDIQSRCKKPAREHVREDRRFVRPSPEKILRAVSREFGVPLTRLVVARRGEVNTGRKVALWALRELGDCTYRQIAELAGLESEKTVGWACQEIETRLRKDPTMKAHEKAIRRAIGQPET